MYNNQIEDYTKKDDTKETFKNNTYIFGVDFLAYFLNVIFLVENLFRYFKEIIKGVLQWK